MMDVGIVHYQIRPADNEIDAVWYTTRMGTKAYGKGIARGDTSGGFPGDFVITYYFPDGTESGTFDLKIEQVGDIYELSYCQNGKTILAGVGLAPPDGLSAGYRKLGFD